MTNGTCEVLVWRNKTFGRTECRNAATWIWKTPALFGDYTHEKKCCDDCKTRLIRDSRKLPPRMTPSRTEEQTSEFVRIDR